MNTYFIAAMKRTGQHAIVNWLAQQLTHDSIHFNNCIKGWEKKQLIAMKPAMAVFYGWNEENKNHKIKNFFHDWKLDKQKSLSLQEEFFKGVKNNQFVNIKSVFYNVEDFDLDEYNKNKFHTFPQLQNLKKVKHILIVRSAHNFVASCLQRKLDPPDPGATDVADFLSQRMLLWKQHAKEALGENSRYYTIKFDTWFTSIDYRRKICDDLGLTFSDNGLNTVMNFGSGSSFDGQNFDENAQKMKVINRWIQYEDKDELFSYIDDETKELNQKLFGKAEG